jgi:HEAT repeat protein
MFAALVSLVMILPQANPEVIPNPSNEAPVGAAELTALLANPCWQVRFWGADTLGQVSPPPVLAIAALRGRADDACEEPLVRSFALKALSRMGQGANAVVPDLPKLLSDRNWLVRQSAEDALENLGRGTPEEMFKTLPGVQRLVAENGGARSPFEHFAQGPTTELLGVVPSLLALLHDPCYDVRRLAADALGSIGWSVQESLKGGQEFIDTIDKAHVPFDAKEKATVTDRLAASKTLFEQMETALVAELGDAEPLVRVASVDALRRMARERAVAHLARMLPGEMCPGVQRAAAAALGSIGAEVPTAAVGAPVEAALVELFGRAEPQTRAVAVAALGQVVPGTESVTAKLKEALRADPDTRVKAAALEAIQVRAPRVAGQ